MIIALWLDVSRAYLNISMYGIKHIHKDYESSDSLLNAWPDLTFSLGSGQKKEEGKKAKGSLAVG